MGNFVSVNAWISNNWTIDDWLTAGLTGDERRTRICRAMQA
jgi:hypothetical protein